MIVCHRVRKKTPASAISQHTNKVLTSQEGTVISTLKTHINELFEPKEGGITVTKQRKNNLHQFRREIKVRTAVGIREIVWSALTPLEALSKILISGLGDPFVFSLVIAVGLWRRRS